MFVVLVLYVHASVCSWNSVPQYSVPDGVMILPDLDLDFPPGGDMSWRGRHLNHRSGWMHTIISVIMIILVVTGLAIVKYPRNMYIGSYTSPTTLGPRKSGIALPFFWHRRLRWAP